VRQSRWQDFGLGEIGLTQRVGTGRLARTLVEGRRLASELTDLGKSATSRYVVFLGNFVSLVIMARFFGPKDFGAVAAVQAVSMLFLLMAEAGIGANIVQKRNITKHEANAYFTIAVGYSLFLALSLAILSPLLGAFYNISGTEVLVVMAAAGVFISGVGTVPAALLQRERRFGKIAVAALIADGLATLCAILLRSEVAPHYALASRALTLALVQAAILYKTCAVTETGRPHLGPYRSVARSIGRFSSFQVLFNFVGFSSKSIDDVAIGKFFGPDSLGYYNRAYQLTRYMLTLSVFAVTPGLQTMVARHNDLAEVEKLHRKVIWVSTPVGVVLTIVAMSSAAIIVRVLLGPGWEKTAELFRIICVAVGCQVIAASTGVFYQASMRTDVMAFCGMGELILVVASVIWGVMTGSLIAMTWIITVTLALASFIYVSAVFLVVYRCSYYSWTKFALIPFLICFVNGFLAYSVS